MLREWVETLVHKYPTMEAVDGAITHEGWKIVGLLRLSPAIPYNVLNYALSLTGSVLLLLPPLPTTARIGSPEQPPQPQALNPKP